MLILGITLKLLVAICKMVRHNVKASNVLFLVLLSILSLYVVNTHRAKAQDFEIIYILADGSVEPSIAPISSADNVTYTFTSDIIDSSIVVLRDNIIVDGAGYTIQGQGEIGIELSYRSNVTIRNVQIWGLQYGIVLWNSFNNTITGNTIAYNMWGIIMQNASRNIISGNNITNNGEGISIYSSSNNKLRNNSLDKSHFAIYGTELPHFVNDIDVSNTINSKQIYYLVNESDLVVGPSTFPDLGFLALVNCARITVQNLEITKNWQGVLLAFTTDSTVTQNTITNNNIGVVLYSSFNNIISGNNITNNYGGIQLSGSSKSNSIYANSITNNRNGIYLLESSQNTINGNNITNSEIGIGFSASSNNMIYHNYFISNTRQVYDSHMDNRSMASSVNFWDFGYPLGGNYWSNYAGLDVKSGSNQDQPSSDGIGDTPYIIYENNKDNYPLMPYGSPPAISIDSPENKTYTLNHVDLTFTVSEATSWIGYSLDGEVNVTIAGNTSLSRLSTGSHRLVVYANDTDGKTGTSETIYFTIAQQSEPFPITWIIAAAAIIAIGGAAFLVYFRKTKKQTQKVRAQPPKPPVTKEVPRPEKAIPQTRKAIYCIHCGEKLPPHAVYCRKCGKKVE
jgi:parallel beta-helix repeat protein